MIYKKVFKKLKDLNYKISFAESYTGGMLASLLVGIPGSSSVFDESYVTYSNDSKQKLLNVLDKTINSVGVVSSECVIEMAEGLYNQTKANVCISTSGIAGPGGATQYKKVGLVYFCIKINDKNYVYTREFKLKIRNYIRKKSCYIIYKVLFKLLNTLNKEV